MANSTTTSMGQQKASSIYWAIELEINTDSRRKDIPGNPSDAEVVLEAMLDRQKLLFDDLEKQRDAWVTTQGLSQGPIYESLASGDLARTLEQIKVCAAYIGILASHLAVDLRTIGNSIAPAKAK